MVSGELWNQAPARVCGNNDANCHSSTTVSTWALRGHQHAARGSRNASALRFSGCLWKQINSIGLGFRPKPNNPTKLVGIDSKVILMRQTCDQLSHTALAFFNSMWMCYMFLISKCKRKWHLGLCIFPELLQRAAAHYDLRLQTHLAAKLFEVKFWLVTF